MTKTPFVDLKSEDILSAHVSGIQHAVNKLEGVLNMKTTAVTNHPLVAVIDQEDATLHNFIYEGTIRNWLTSPLVVIKRNGVVVDASEYKLQAPYGAIVFIGQQNESDVITADFTYVTEGSQTIDDMNVKLNNVGAPGFHLPGTWRTHLGQATVPTPQYTTTTSASGQMDAFPFYVSEPTTYDQMKVTISTGGGTKLKMAIYSNVNGYPGNKIAETVEGNPGATGDLILNFSGGNVTLQPGMYWIVKWHDGAPQFGNCLYNTQAIPLGDSNDTTNLLDSLSTGAYQIGGVRQTISYTGTYPATFATLAQGARYFKRASYCSPWIKRALS